MSLTKAKFRMISGQSYNVKDYGAVGDNVSDDTTAIQAAINAADSNGGGTIYFPSGFYKTDSQVNLVSNLQIIGEMNATLMPSESVPSYAYLAEDKNNIKITGLVFEGTGTAFTDGTQRLLQLNNCSETQIHNCTFRKSRNTAVVIDNCDQGRMSGCLFEFSYSFGAEIRNNSFSWVVSDCVFYQNGETGVATSNSGRGLVLWESTRISVTNCTFKDQTEYGVRYYSQTGDNDFTQQIALNNCTFENNGTSGSGKIDLYLFNEVGDLRNFAISNCTFRTRPGNTAIAAQGTSLAISNCSIKSAGQDQGTAVEFFKATNAALSNCVITGFSSAFSFSSSEQPEQINIGNCQIINCFRLASNVFGNNTVIHDCYIKQSASGASSNEVVLKANVPEVTGAKIVNNTFDSCYRVIELEINNCEVEFSGNTCINTQDITVRCFGDNLTNLIFYGNKLDKGTNPTILGKIQRMGGILPMVIGKSDVEPTDFTFAKGDMVFNSDATAGGKAGWICTTSGTPGTWKQFGVIDS